MGCSDNIQIKTPTTTTTVCHLAKQRGMTQSTDGIFPFTVISVKVNSHVTTSKDILDTRMTMFSGGLGSFCPLNCPVGLLLKGPKRALRALFDV